MKQWAVSLGLVAVLGFSWAQRPVRPSDFAWDGVRVAAVVHASNLVWD